MVLVKKNLKLSAFVIETNFDWEKYDILGVFKKKQIFVFKFNKLFKNIVKYFSKNFLALPVPILFKINPFEFKSHFAFCKNNSRLIKMRVES